MIHIWWTCKEIQSFWRLVHDTMQKMFKINIPHDPRLYLLNMTSLLKKYDEKRWWRVLLYCITAARIEVAKRWKMDKIPSWDIWMQKIEEYRDLDKISCNVKNYSRYRRKEEWESVVNVWGGEWNLNKASFEI